MSQALLIPDTAYLDCWTGRQAQLDAMYFPAKGTSASHGQVGI